MRIGKMDRRIAILPVVITRDGMGIEKEDHDSAARLYCHAAVSFGSGQERREAGANEASQVATFRCRWRSALSVVTPRAMIEFEGGRWGITSMPRVGPRGSEIEFSAVRRL